MALIKCSECGREISDKASACIHCGCPITAAKQAPAPADEVTKIFEKITGGKQGITVDFHATITADASSTRHFVFVQEIGRSVEFNVPASIQVGQNVRVLLQDHPTYGFVLFKAISVTKKEAPEGVGAISSDRARELLDKYKPSLLVKFFTCGIIPKIVALFIGGMIYGELADVDFEFLFPFLVFFLVLLALCDYYPLFHIKRYMRKHKIDDAIRNDSGPMNVAIKAFNECNSKAMIRYITKLNPDAGAELKRQLAELKKKK